MKETINIHWFRRDLRLEDNPALNAALASPYPVLPLFIFDDNIIDELPVDDARVTFIYQQLNRINEHLSQSSSSGIHIKKGQAIDIWKEIISQFDIAEVHFNRDYEPYAIQRDERITKLLQDNNIKVVQHQDHVIFEADKILKKDASPYTVYTPYKKQWLSLYEKDKTKTEHLRSTNFLKHTIPFPTLDSLGLKTSSIYVPDWNLSNLDHYAEERDIPSLDSTTHLGPHLRFGTISIRQILNHLGDNHEVFLSELIWREFFLQILVHFPHVVSNNFKASYNAIRWRNNEAEFKHWCNGTTGYPMVDAGMRQLNTTGFMHNRVRMVCASFLCKHLLIDWRWGEAYFAEKLLDYELASNNGNWQWAAGTGCDAAPYFRIFNPSEQQKKFDPELKYIRQWIDDFNSSNYPAPIVEHKAARERAISSYKKALNEKKAI